MKISELSLPFPYHPSMDVLDSTKIKCYQECPRKFFYEYVLGWQSSRPSNHLIFGQAVHKALEYLVLNGYRVESAMAALEIFNKEYRLTFLQSTDVLFEPKTPARFLSMLIEYIKKYSDDHSRYTVYKTEIGGMIHLSPAHVMAFKMDTILYDNERQLYVSLEHKTKGGNYIGPNYIYDFMLSTQLGTYTHVLNSLFPVDEVGEVIINCLCFKKTKGHDFILERFPIPLTPKQMDNWLETTKAWMDRIYTDYTLLAGMDQFDDNMNCFHMNGTACTNWGRVCHNMQMCTAYRNPLRHIDRLPVDMEVRYWNPLEEDLTEVVNL